MLISFIPISGKGEKGALKEWDNAPNKSNIPTAFQASKIPQRKADGFFHTLKAKNNAVVPIIKSPINAIFQTDGAERSLPMAPRVRNKPEPIALNTIQPVTKIKTFTWICISTLPFWIFKLTV